jgi:hypothetical protein
MRTGYISQLTQAVTIVFGSFEFTTLFSISTWIAQRRPRSLQPPSRVRHGIAQLLWYETAAPRPTPVVRSKALHLNAQDLKLEISAEQSDNFVRRGTRSRQRNQ